jgi:hypothetical protein
MSKKNSHEFVQMSMAINEAGGGFFDGNFLQVIDKVSDETKLRQS